MEIELRPLTPDDAPAHCDGEDDAMVTWLSGGRAPTRAAQLQGALAHFAMLARNAEAHTGKRGFGVWVDGRLGGYVDFDPDMRDGLEDGDINITYGVHAWARGRGVAGRAVELICAHLRREPGGLAAALRIDVDNAASLRVAEKLPGFEFVRDYYSELDKTTLRLFRRTL